MALRFPNRTGELGVLAAGVVTLSGSALPGMRTFAAALAAQRIADGDRVGLAVSSASDPNRWAVWRADYSEAGTLAVATIEDASPEAIPDGATVAVVAVITDDVMRWIDVVEPVPSYYDGPDYWTPDGADAVWNSGESAYQLIGESTSGLLTPAAWATGFRPARISLEIFVPAEEALQAAQYAGFVILYAGGSPGNQQVPIDSGVQFGWNAVTADLANTTDDISGLVLLAGDAAALAGYRWRHILFEE